MSDFPFKFYNPNLPTRITYRHLPHWEQDGCCAFVTMRLNDSIPRSVLEDHNRLRRNWLREHGLQPDQNPSEILSQLSETAQRGFQRFASRLYQNALDKGAGSCVFQRPDVRNLLVETLQGKEGAWYRLGDYVVMPNHLHMLIQPFEDLSLKKVLSSIRRVSAREINPLLGRKGTLWQPEPFDHLARSRSRFDRHRRYIALNPKRARLVERQFTHWEYGFSKS